VEKSGLGMKWLKNIEAVVNEAKMKNRMIKVVDFSLENVA